jgi:hypothetical protein
MPKSFKPEVIVDAGDKWASNALRFATEEEAFLNAKDLSWRWFAVREFRATPCEDPPNYAYVDHKLVPLKARGSCGSCAAKGVNWDAPREDGSCYECGGPLTALEAS